MSPAREGGRLPTFDVGAELGGEGEFMEGSGGEAEDRLGGGFFGGGETMAIHYEDAGLSPQRTRVVPIHRGKARRYKHTS